MIKHIPNILSLLRIVGAPVLIALALNENYAFFIIFLALSQFTDFLDGYLARKLNAQSLLGAKLDVIGDACNYLVGLVGVSVFFPELMSGFRFFFVVLFTVLYSGRFMLSKICVGEWVHPLPLKIAKINFYVQSVLIVFLFFRHPVVHWLFVVSYVVMLAETVQYLWVLRQAPIPVRARSAAVAG